jgi:cobalt-precorrin-5B (C1)-methyltransferase
VVKLKRSIKRSDLRCGYTTGACAAAAARAAVRMLITQQPFAEIEITLPNKEKATFLLERLQGVEPVLAGVIKDGGDDPDCTHGLEIQCRARWSSQPGIKLLGGQGVAQVTLPGLELQVGQAAINPVPRANITAMVALELAQTEHPERVAKGVELTFIIPGGEQAARETISERLGLLGGISILGTRGTVKPYSTSAYAASVTQACRMAAVNGLEQLLLTTGSRSEKAAMRLFPGASEMAFIQAGDFMGIGLRAAKRYQLQKVTMVVMIGKMAKLLSGKMMTHVSGHAVDFDFLRLLAEEEGLPESLCMEIGNANTGRHVLELVRSEPGAQGYLKRLCKETHYHAEKYVRSALAIEVILIDFDGTALAGYPA